MDEEKLFLQKLLEKGKWSLCKKHLYKGLSKSSCFVNLNEIKNTLLKHQICWKISAKSAGLKRETYFTNSYIFLNFFYIRNTNFQEHREFFLFIFFFFWNVSSNNLLSLFLRFFKKSCFLQAGYSSTYFFKILLILKGKYDGIIYFAILQKYSIV